MNQPTNNSPALLTLINLSDSALPIGGYSHSWGLETWVQSGDLQSAEDVHSCIKALLLMSIGPQDGTACALAHRYQKVRDFTMFAKLNEQLSAARWPKETFKASISMGERLYKLAAEVGIVEDQRERLPQQLHHSATFGWISAAADITTGDATSAFIYSTCTNLISACVRLIPLGQTDEQKILARLRPAINVVASSCIDSDLDEVGSFAPLNEWAGIEHETLYSRLFQS
ncbi:MAG TPA: urease accessory protein UreF [Planktothrix sp.]